MAKRFTDTEKWDDPWFFGLSTIHKLFWLYLLDNCDISGGWKVNQKIVNLRIGAEINLDEFLEIAGKRIELIEGRDIWFINKFIIFQYGNLNESNKIFRSVQNALILNGGSKGDLWGIDPPKTRQDNIKRGGVGEISTGKITTHFTGCKCPKCR